MKNNIEIKAYVTNLGKYNEGELVGEWVTFPIDEEEQKALFKRIGINEQYEEYFITDYESSLDLYGLLGEYSSIANLNKLSEMLDSCDDIEKLEAVMEVENVHSIKDIENIINNLDDYTLLEGIDNNYDLGYYYINECGCVEIPEYLENYIDYEAYGRDCSFDGSYTSYGFLLNC